MKYNIETATSLYITKYIRLTSLHKIRCEAEKTKLNEINEIRVNPVLQRKDILKVFIC